MHTETMIDDAIKALQPEQPVPDKASSNNKLKK